MVPKTSGEKPDYRFWVSVIGLFVAIIGSWVSAQTTAASNTERLGSVEREVRVMREDVRENRTVMREILMELRK